MAMMLPLLSSKEQKRVEIPTLAETEIQGVSTEIEKVI